MSCGISYEDVASKYTSLSAQEAFNSETIDQLDYPAELRALAPEPVWVTSCGGGNPFELGKPCPGQSVADLGCGAGVDVCIAAALVGSRGWVLGIDLNPAMLTRARESLRLSAGTSDGKTADVAFVEAPFDDPSHNLLQPHLGQYDLVTSNGALCLSFDMARAFSVAFALLRPGGRFQLFDLCRVDGTVPDSLGQKTQDS